MDGYLIEFFNGRYVFCDVESFPLENEFIDIDIKNTYGVAFSSKDGITSCKVKPLKESPLDFQKIQIARSSIASVNKVGNESILKNRIIEAKTNLCMPDLKTMGFQKGQGV